MIRVCFLQSGDILYWLKKKLRSSEQVKIAVAYLSQDGLKELETDLKLLLNKGGKIELIVGISDYHITDSEALTNLLKMDDDYSNLEVEYFYHEGFHPKIFLFGERGKRAAIVGSSNLTVPGLTNNVEANILLEGKKEDEVFKEIDIFFQNLWKAARYLDENIIESYRNSQRRTKGRTYRTKLKIPKTKIPRTSDLPSVHFVRSINQGRAYWKVAPGRHAREWPWWENRISPDNKGFIAIGWNLVGDLREVMSRPEVIFKAEVQRRVINAKYDSDPYYAAKQFWLFCKLIKEGDIVVAYSRRHIFGIAEVESPYYFDTEDASKDYFAHKRDVSWKALPRIVPPKHIMSILATNDTVHALTNTILIRYVKTFL